MKPNTTLMGGILLIALILPKTTISQNNESSRRLTSEGVVVDVFSKYLQNQINKGLTKEEYEGSPYLNSESQDNTLIYDQQQITNINLRYNVYKDAMEIEQDDSFYLIPRSNSLFDDFIIDGHHFKLITNFENKNYKDYYLEVLSENNNITLYKLHRVTYFKASAPAPYSEAKPARYVDSKPIYFISTNNSDLNEITSQKELIRNLSEIKSELTSYMKRNNLHYKNEDELINVIEYADNLLN